MNRRGGGGGRGIGSYKYDSKVTLKIKEMRFSLKEGRDSLMILCLAILIKILLKETMYFFGIPFDSYKYNSYKNGVVFGDVCVCVSLCLGIVCVCVCVRARVCVNYIYLCENS